MTRLNDFLKHFQHNSHFIKQKTMKKYIYSALVIFATSSLFGEIKMPSIFGDNMMFQQEKPIRIWGSAEPNATVKAEFNGKQTQVKADTKGEWEMSLPAEKASFDAKKLIVSENGKVNKTFKNILVGEIWIAGGQSNMEWKVKNSTDKEKAIENAKKLNGKIRYFLQSSGGYSKVPKMEFQKGAQWIIVDDKNVEKTSAVGYYFAERLLKDLNIPVAIIYASKGGTHMAAWTDKETLLNGWTKNYKTFTDIIKTLETYDNTAYQKAVTAHKEKLAKHDKAVAEAKKAGKKPPSVPWYFRYPPSTESPIPDYKTPIIHFNGKIVPMRNFVVRGVIWYQGESDAGTTEQLKNFTESFGMVIDSWRRFMQAPDLPFLQVQLASFGTTADWATARQAQLKNTKVFKNVYMAPIIDCGEKHDIHPKNKTTVGERLEKIALAKIYGRTDIVADAPEVESVTIKNGNSVKSKFAKKFKNKGDEAIVTFKTFGKKLIGKGEPRGFEVLVGDKWVKANASLKGEIVTVKSPNGEKIKAVRYLWSSWTIPNVWLYNEDGLPALPF